MSELAPVDVVILSWNRAPMTIDAVASARDQRDIDPNVIVLDQGSDPGQLELLRAAIAGHDRVTLTEVGENLGVPGGRNRAAVLGSAPYIFNLDNDALFDTDTTLAGAVSHLEENPDVAVASLRILNHTTGDDDPNSWTYPAALRSRSDERLRVAKFLGGAHIVRRSVFDGLRGFDPDLFFGGEEMDFAFRAIDAGHAIDYLGDLRVRHRVDPEHRVQWSDDRFYYFVRNGQYVHEKYLPSRFGLSARGLARLAQGVRNRYLGQTIRGLRDARRMLRAIPSDEREALALSEQGQAYYARHHTDLEGSLVDKVRATLARR